MKNIFIINSPYLSKKQIRDIYTLHPSGIDIEIIILYLIATVGIIVISVYYCISYYKKIHQSKSTEEKVKELYTSKQSDNTNIIDKSDRQLLGESQRVDNKEQSGICWSEADEEKNQQKEETSSNKLKERKSNHDNKTSEINLIDDTVSHITKSDISIVVPQEEKALAPKKGKAKKRNKSKPKKKKNTDSEKEKINSKANNE